MVSAVWGASALVGPLVGGLFAEAGIWRWAYFSFALQALVLIVLAPRLLSQPRQEAAPAASSRVPWASLAVLVPAVLAVAGAGVVESAVPAAALALGGLLLLALVLRIDRRAANPLLPHGSLRAAGVRAGLAVVLTFSTASVSFTLYGPLLLVGLHGVGALTAGYLIAIEAVAWSLAALLVSGVGPAGEGRWLKIGGGCIVAGIASFAYSVPYGPIWSIALSALFAGAGFGLFWSFLVRRTVAAALPGERERTAGAMPTLQMLGYALGAAFAGVVANAQGMAAAPTPEQLGPIAVWLFLAFVPLTLLGLASAFRVAR